MVGEQLQDQWHDQWQEQWTADSVDRLEQDFAELTAAISRLDALRIKTIRALDIAQVATADGARTMVEWLAGRFDLETDTARALLDIARASNRELERDLDGGRVTTDRAAAVTRLRSAGADEHTVDRSRGHDLAGVRQLTSRHRRITRSQEVGAAAGGFLHLQPALDESHWKLWGRLDGIDGRIVDKAIHTAVEALPHNPDTTSAQDRADGLVSVASEWLSGEIGGHEMTAEIFIDAQLATITDGEAGATILSGPRIGPNGLAEILCAGTTRINVLDPLGVVSTTPSSRAIPSAIRHRVLHRDGHRCVIAGCNSRTRLQIHHLVAFSEGGTHALHNLVTVCWYHHHVVIHRQGRRLDLDSPPQRRTFLRANPLRAGP